MNIYRNVSERVRGMGVGTISIFLLTSMTLALPAKSRETWNCEETAFYSVYEDVSRTEGKSVSNSKTLKWIDADTIGFEVMALTRITPNADTFFNESSGSSLQINPTERPYLVLLTQPQVWMNKFGNLRVRFYRCTP